MASANFERQGTVQDDMTGETFIPASQRPDGSWRKPRRVKEGYIPQDEMPTYENKGVKWMKSKSDLPPGLHPDDVKKSTQKETFPGQPLSKSAQKNLKRKEKKKQQKEEQVDKVEKVTLSLAETSITHNQSEYDKGFNSQSHLSAGAHDEQDVLKKVRNLKKKLKQTEELERKIQSGELKNPEKDQLEKVAKKKTLVHEIEKLNAILES